MRPLTRFILSTILCLYPKVGFSTTYEVLISNAIKRFEDTPRERWFYQITRFENEEGDISRSLEQYNPQANASSKWSLLRINGGQPNEKETHDFNERRNKPTGKKNDYSLKLRELIQIDTLYLIEEKPQILHIGFDVQLERLGKNASKKLTGALIYNKQDKFVESIEIVNTDTFSPLFSAKINDFKLTLTFIEIEDAILPHEHKLLMQGTFALFSEINEISTDTYSNYEFIGAARE